jgi:hypothetical protein
MHIFKDIFTGKDHAFPSDTKTDFLAYLRFTFSWYEDYGWMPRILRTDIENVLKSEDVVRYLDAKHIRFQNSGPYSHWQQSVERDIKTIVKGTSCLLRDLEFLKSPYWDHAKAHFVDVRGHVPNKFLGDRSPIQVITQKSTNVGNRYKFYWGEPVLLTIVPQRSGRPSGFPHRSSALLSQSHYKKWSDQLGYHLGTICEVLLRATLTPPATAQSGHDGHSF